MEMLWTFTASKSEQFSGENELYGNRKIDQDQERIPANMLKLKMFKNKVEETEMLWNDFRRTETKL